MQCIFCQIVRGEVSSEKVYEDEHTLGLMDINPCAPGHVIIVPKEHVQSILELDNEKTAHIYRAVKALAEQVKRALNPDGFNIGINDGQAAGQGIDHSHIHIIPRWQGDKGGSMHTIVRNPPKEEISVIAAKIRKEWVKLPKKEMKEKKAREEEEKEEEKHEELERVLRELEIGR
jgi:histidine triad (HIT) family protein